MNTYCRLMKRKPKLWFLNGDVDFRDTNSGFIKGSGKFIKICRSDFFCTIVLKHNGTRLIKGKCVIVSILKSLYSYGALPKDMMFKIFDTKVCAQLLYGSELWGTGNYDCLERIQYYVCKRLLCVNQRSSNCAVMAECGRFPLYIETYKLSFNYWLKILSMPNQRYDKK